MLALGMGGCTSGPQAAAVARAIDWKYGAIGSKSAAVLSSQRTTNSIGFLGAMF